jgi:hypothetical protein
MCTFRDERTVLVCDPAIDRVRAAVGTAFADAVRFTHVDGEPTLVEAHDSVDAGRFGELVRVAIATSQEPTT